MNLDTIIEYDKKYYMNTFGDRVPVAFTHGSGVNLWDTDGKKYVDLFAGVAVSALGHSHPKLVKAITEQAGKFLHCSSHYYIESQAMLAKVLAENSCMDRVFFSNSGAEANEGAIKLARKYFKVKGKPHKYEIITLVNSFHGRTLTTAAAGGQDKYKVQFSPLPQGFKHVPINDIESIKDEIGENTCAIMLEPVQGESGVHPVTGEYLKLLRELCDKNDILLIFDEVQCGVGRTGKLFAYEVYGVEPDIITLAKALGGGVPIGAVLAKEFAASAFVPGDHGSTFGGNPLACAAGLAVMDALLNDGLIENAGKMGSYFFEKLSQLMEKHDLIKDVRGIGLMIGVELSGNIAADVRARCLKKGYIISNVGASVLRILPPLILTTEDIDGFITVLDEVLQSV
ncbi:MAG TPA: aspartate aminotransferase family protein [Clostridia bacterium]